MKVNKNWNVLVPNSEHLKTLKISVNVKKTRKKISPRTV
jgi:hypothetical protein